MVEANSSFSDTYTSTTSINPHLRVRNQNGTDNIYGGIQLRADRGNGAAAIFNIACLNSSTNYASTLVFQSRNSDGNFSEKVRITSGGTLESYSTNDTTPNIKWRSNDTNWFGSLNQSVHGGTITSFLSCGGDWSADGTTYSATKALAAYPTSAIAVHNQYNNNWGTEFVFLTKAGGSTTTDLSLIHI